MTRFVLRRLLESTILLLLLSLLVFSLFKLIPGDYLAEMEMNPQIPAERVEELRSRYGLNQPVWQQYGSWLIGLTSGRLGYSFSQRRPAVEVIWERMGRTLLLTCMAFSIIVVLVFPLGVVSALYNGYFPDHFIRVLTLLGLSIPTVLAALLFLYATFWMGIFPVGKLGFTDIFFPALTMALPAVAFLLRALRLELIEVFEQPFILAAVAGGLPPHRVLVRALRHALNPMISLMGVTLGGLLSGAVVVEKVFNWPGLGALIVDSILSRDLFVALNCVLVSAALVIAANLAADLTLAINDHRIRYR